MVKVASESTNKMLQLEVHYLRPWEFIGYQKFAAKNTKIPVMKKPQFSAQFDEDTLTRVTAEEVEVRA